MKPTQIIILLLTTVIILTGSLLSISIMLIDTHNKSESQHGYITQQQETIKQLNKEIFLKEVNNKWTKIINY